MARIPQDELDRLKREVSIARLAAARGIELKRSGDSLVGLCPFHEETEESFRINEKRNVFHCFGCGAKGSVIDFVMLLEGVSFRHAVEILRAEHQGVPYNADGSAPQRPKSQKLPALLDPGVDEDQLRTDVALYYCEVLGRSPEAKGYVRRRGLDTAVIGRYKLGFSNRTLGYRIPHSQTKVGNVIRGRLQQLGIMKTSGHELMRGSLTIPIFNGDGRVVQMYGRKINDNLRKGTPKHLYLPGPRRGVWNLESLAESKEIILCEALIDALTFASAGFTNVTSAYGKNGFTQEHLEALKAYGTQRVLIAYDRDVESEPAAEALAGRLGAEGISCFRVQFPAGMDANEYALKVKPPAQSLAVLLRASKYMSGPLKTLTVLPAPAPTAKNREPRQESEPSGPAADSAPAQEPASSLIAGSAPDAAEEPQEVPASPAAPASEPPPPRSSSPPAEDPAPEPDRPAPASPVPPVLAVDVPAEVREHEVEINLGDRRYRVRGMARNMSFEQLRINLLVAHGECFHVDNLDLYSARQRGIFLKQASEELQLKQEVLKRDVGKVLLKLEQLQEERIRKALEAKEEPVVLNDQERTEALSLLQDPKLLRRISEDFETCGLVGEHINKLVGYLAAVSRKLEKPLAVMVQSSSAAGKSALMEAVLAFMPEEERVQYSAMTGQSLFYMGETNLKHKVLAIAEEEGAERASYSLKLLQSEGELTIASTGKEPSTGRLVTHEYHVEGPTAIVLTTTAIDLDEELQNRCIVLAVDESREQTEAIHRMQRLSRTREGAVRRKRRPHIRKVHRNAQRLLRPLEIRNPYSSDLTFLTKTTRTRRDQEKYLSLIDAIALLHQHQRQVKTDMVAGERDEYIEVTLADIAVANRLANEALGRTLDELPPQTRRLLFLIHEMVRAECERRQIEQRLCRFSRRDIREYTGWGNTQLKVHLHRLEEMEYLLVHRGGRGQSFVYELLYDGEGKDGSPFVLGLINVDKLREKHQGRQYDSNRSGSESKKSGSGTKKSESGGERSGSSRPQVGGVSGGCRGDSNAPDTGDNPDSGPKSPRNAHQGIQQDAVVVTVPSSVPEETASSEASDRDEEAKDRSPSSDRPESK